MASDSGGRPVAGWLARRGTRHRVAGLDETGEPAWSCEVPGLTRKAALVGGGDGRVLLAADPEANRLHVIDAVAGRVLHRIEGTAPSDGDEAPHLSRPLSLSGHHGVAIDPSDGSVVVLARAASSRGPLLMRFKADGTPLPLWGKRRRSRRSSVITLIMGPGGLWDPPPWDELSDKVLIPPAGARMTVGGDGLLYLVAADLRRVAAWDRGGVLQFNRELEPQVSIGQLLALTVDSRGTLYAATRLDTAGGPHAHILRLAHEGRPELWLGPHSDNPAPLGADDHHLTCDAHGRLFIGGNLRSLRVFDDNGLLRWRSPATERADAEAAPV
ncbi:MAG TPA: hypothetical protein VL172_19565 [Kofleriaceae bacterium]|nr:hypothetical protein [Kofleriaceae bacterium]